MYGCTHGPKKDCHACLIPELVDALERMMMGFSHVGQQTMCQCPACKQARALIAKAKQLEDCMPREDAAEAAASQERWR